MSCPPCTAHSGVSLQDLASDMYDPPSIKPLMSLSLTLGSFFSLEAGQEQGFTGLWGAAQHGVCSFGNPRPFPGSGVTQRLSLPLGPPPSPKKNAADPVSNQVIPEGPGLLDPRPALTLSVQPVSQREVHLLTHHPILLNYYLFHSSVS